MLASQRHDLGSMGLDISAMLYFPPCIWKGIGVFHGALAAAGDLPVSSLDTGIDIIRRSIWRVRQLVYISTACAGHLPVLDIIRLIAILPVGGARYAL